MLLRSAIRLRIAVGYTLPDYRETDVLIMLNHV